MRTLLSLALLAASGCPWNAAGNTGCQPLGSARPLPEELRESSGVAWSHRFPGVLWSHNDSGDSPELFALDQDGRVLQRYPLRGARARDWEDIASGPCGPSSCLYIADTGDNAEHHRRIFLYRVPEPGGMPGSAQAAGAPPDTLGAESYPMLLPNGARDIESLFVLPGEDVYLVSKGRSDAVTVFRYPPPLRPGEEVTLEEVQFLSDGALAIPSQVTAADASRDGSLVVIRTYESMRFYQPEGGRLVPLPDAAVNLRTLQEAQGEGVALGPDGTVALTSEAGQFGGFASLRLLRCSALPGR